MSLIINNKEVDAMAARLAEITGQSVEAVVAEALRERLQRVSPEHKRTGMAARLMEIGRRCASRPVLDPRSPDEIIGYDEHGLPK
jgi:antitoxin VapB